jgi:hypothetical protein
MVLGASGRNVCKSIVCVGWSVPLRLNRPGHQSVLEEVSLQLNLEKFPVVRDLDWGSLS